MNTKERAQWGSKIGFILATAGSAIGLGNIWKFPGKAYAGGGGAYLVIYLAIVILIGIPMMLSEISLGRHAQKNTIGAFHSINPKYSWIGWIAVFTPFAILGYYSQVGGWVTSYIFSYITEPDAVMADGLGYFYNFLGYDAATGATHFPWKAILFGAAFAILTAYIIIKGVKDGIEKFNKIAMPLLLVILVVMLIRCCSLPGASDGLSYMLTCDWSKVDSGTLMSALGQAFFSLSVGMSILVTYGSYVGKDDNINRGTFMIAGLDTGVAFLAGFIIVPAVFATLGAEEVGKGGGFAFASLAGVFKAMPLGSVWGFMFYLLLFFAALSSCISVLEGIVSFVCEEWKFTRTKAAIIITAICYVFGVLYTITQASVSMQLPWADFTGITMTPVCDWMECLTDRILIPLTALAECIFIGWIWGTHHIKDEVTTGGVTKFSWYPVYRILIKFLCPIAIGAIIIYSFATGTTVS